MRYLRQIKLDIKELHLCEIWTAEARLKKVRHWAALRFITHNLDDNTTKQLYWAGHASYCQVGHWTPAAQKKLSQL